MKIGNKVQRLITVAFLKSFLFSILIGKLLENISQLLYLVLVVASNRLEAKTKLWINRYSLLFDVLFPTSVVLSSRSPPQVNLI